MEASYTIGQEFAKGQGNVAKVVRANYLRLQMDIPVDVASLVTKFEVALARSQELSKKVSTWTLIEGEQGVKEMASLCGTLEEVSSILKQHIDTMKGQRESVKNDANKARIRDEQVRNKALARYRPVVP